MSKPLVAPVARSPRNGERCNDFGAPFDVSHYGKMDPINLDPAADFEVMPRGHCVVTSNQTNDLALVRFTPFSPFYTELATLVPNVGAATELHIKHLQKLGEYGLTPWFTDIQAGGVNNGIFILQDLLPDDANIEPDDPEIDLRVENGYEAYMAWVRSTRQPAFLSDVFHAGQYSLIGDTLYLHDVEPLYDKLKA